MFNKKMKALTFSYDDGVTQDVRLIELFNKYGMKATFNLNSELLGKSGELIREGVRVNHTKVDKREIRSIYEGHEVAVHTLTHPNLNEITSENEIIRQVEQDRINLCQLCGYEIVGMAYPGGGVNFNKQAADIIKKNTGVKYSRTTVPTGNFDIQTDLMQFKPTVHHHNNMDELFRLGEKFLAMNPNVPQLFYVWGHSYEFDIHDDWAQFEEFLQMMSGKDDILYCTNKDALL